MYQLSEPEYYSSAAQTARRFGVRRWGRGLALRASRRLPAEWAKGLSYALRPRLSRSFAAVAKTRNEGVVAVRRSGAAPRRTSPAAFGGLAGHAQSPGPLQLSE